MKEKLSESEKNARANEKRRKHKEAKDKLLSTKNKEGGLLLVHTGKGKGKTTAAMGMVARCIGHGKKVGIVQLSNYMTLLILAIINQIFIEDLLMMKSCHLF